MENKWEEFMEVEIALSLGNNEIVTINTFHFPKANNKETKKELKEYRVRWDI